MKLKLDAKTTAALTLSKGRDEEIAWDADAEGFGFRLRRRTDGGVHRSWIVQYRAAGRTRRITVGSAERLTAVEARQAARKLLARVELGDDPQATRETKRQQAACTFRSVVESYLAAKQPELRPTSLRVTKLYLTGPYFRTLQPLAISDITRADVATSIRTIVNKHSVTTAAAARRALSAVFAWAIADGLLGNGANPVTGTHRPDDPTPRSRVLDDRELAAILKTVGCDTEYGKILWLLALLGARASEIGGCRWSECDLIAGTWTLPSERSKNHRAYTITLPPAALAIIRSVPQTEREHLFGARAGAGFTSWPWHKQELDRKLGDAVKSSWRLHDIRRSTATGLADIGIEPHVIEAVLNHYSGHRRDIHGTYNRSSYEKQVTSALLRWSEHVLALVEGRTATNVVTLRA
jgi:integrase